MEANERFFNPSTTMHYDDSSPTHNSPNSLLVLLPKSLCSLFRHHTFCQLIQRRFIIIREQNSLKIHFHILCSLADTPNEVIQLKWMANNWLLHVPKHTLVCDTVTFQTHLKWDPIVLNKSSIHISVYVCISVCNQLSSRRPKVIHFRILLLSGVALFAAGSLTNSLTVQRFQGNQEFLMFTDE